VPVHANTKKLWKIPPFCLKGPKSENLKNSYFLSEMAYFDYYFCLDTKAKILKNC